MGATDISEDFDTQSFSAQLIGGSSASLDTFRELKSNVCDAILAALVVLGTPALVASFFRGSEFEQTWAVVFQATLLCAMGLLLFYRRSVPYTVKAYCLLGVIYVLGIVGWVSFGLLAGGKMFLLVYVLLTAIFFGFRASIFAILISMLTLTLVAYGYMSGRLAIDVAPRAYHTALSSWVTAGFTVVLFGGFISSGIAMLFQAQLKTLRLVNEQAGFLDTVIAQSNTLLMVVDRDLVLQNHNERAAKIFATNETAFKGQSVKNLLKDGSGSRRLLAAMEESIESQTSTYLEVQHLVAGDLKHLVWNITELQNEEGATIGLVCVAQDVSEIHQAQRQLDHQTRLTAMGEMTTSIAHEINQPLSVIRLVVGGLSKTIGKAIDRSSSIDLEKVRVKLERIDEHVDRAATITNHMRQFGADHQGSKEEFALGEALSNIVTLKNTTYDMRGIKLQVDKSASDMYVIGRKPELEQVFLIVLSNAEAAVKALEKSEEKRISIDFNLDNGTCNVLVKDSGAGVSEADLAHVFDPFFSTRETGEGTGLGLSLARKLMREMGGTIELYNTPTGGACAHIRLPAAQGSNGEQRSTES